MEGGMPITYTKQRWITLTSFNAAAWDGDSVAASREPRRAAPSECCAGAPPLLLLLLLLEEEPLTLLLLAAPVLAEDVAHVLQLVLLLLPLLPLRATFEKPHILSLDLRPICFVSLEQNKQKQRWRRLYE